MSDINESQAVTQNQPSSSNQSTAQSTNQNPSPAPQDESDRYTNQNADQDEGRYAEQTSDSAPDSSTTDMPELATDLTAMIDNINEDLSSLYQEINQHINDQLEQVKESRQDIQTLMDNLGKQLKNTQKK